MDRQFELRPIKESSADFERIEARIKAAFRRLLYLPLLKELNLSKKTISNAKEDLYHALQTGRITYSRGSFRGQFDAQTSKQLKALGAKWNPKSGSFMLSDLPAEVRESISVGKVRFQERIARIDKKITQILPEDISESVKTKDLFDSVLEKTDREIHKGLKDIIVPPKLTPHEREKIAEEWQSNMDLWINNFTKEEIINLRKDIAASALSGNRYESLIESIQRSYGVTANKAKFLARQETSLLMAKFKETRYTSLGIKEYKWRCVTGTKLHPVRPDHKILDGKIYSWDDPPVTDSKTQARNNPGQDYNCRCQAIPIVRFK